MLPRLASPQFLRVTAIAIAGFVGAPVLRAQQGETVDAAKLLKELHAVRDQQSGLIKTGQGAAIQKVSAAAANPSVAVAEWEDAVRITKFEGAGHESTAFQAWKAGDGQAFKESIVQSALRLYFTWLQITIQRSAGTKLKDLLPAIVSYTKDLASDQAAMASLDEAAKREKELNVYKAPARGAKPRGLDLDEIKAVHDAILKRPLGSSIYVQCQKLMDWVNVENWEGTPAEFDGIYEKVVLPEMRDERDPHLLDYWDMMLQKKADEANRTRLAFDVDKYNNIIVPALLWGKYGDMVILGQKSQAFTGMLSLIKKYPTHPDSRDWVTQFETLLAPPKSATVAAPAAPVAAPVPSASAPAAPPAPAVPAGFAPAPPGSVAPGATSPP